MKKFVISLSLFLFTMLLYAQSVEKIWETNKVFDIPESVLFNDSICYVSCVAGNPTEKNDSGYISKINTAGEVLEKFWVTGLNAPKGMGIFNENLYVTDIDQLVIINRFSGKIIKKIDIEGAMFLNDIDVSKDGVVVFSDMADHSIYIYRKHKIEQLLKDDQLKNVNGLNWNENGLFAGIHGAVIKIDTTKKTYSQYIKVIGGIDGLERIDETTMLISDWAGKVKIVSTNADEIELLNFTGESYNAADIDYSPKQSVIFIPTFFGNTVAAYQLVW